MFLPNGYIRDEFFVNRIGHGQIRVDDGRTISGAQRNLAYSILQEIAKYTYHEYQEIKELLKLDFIMKRDIEYFSLSDVDMTTAREYIEFILDFAFMNDVKLSQETVKHSKNIKNWAYLCFKKRWCVICNEEHSHVHHLKTVGAGRNRDKVDHSKMPLIMLCPRHHKEAHDIGNETFTKKYHVAGIYVDVETLKKLNIKGRYGKEVDDYIGNEGEM